MANDFVIDNSVVMSWCFANESNRYADVVLNMLTQATAVVASIRPLEVVNDLLVAERQKRLSESDNMRLLTFYTVATSDPR